MNATRWIIRRLGWTWSAAILALMVWVCVAQVTDHPLPVDLLSGLIVVAAAVDMALTNLIAATEPDAPRSAAVQWIATGAADILTLVAVTAGLTLAYLYLNPEMATRPATVGLAVVAVAFTATRITFGFVARRTGLFPTEPCDPTCECQGNDDAEIAAEGRWTV